MPNSMSVVRASDSTQQASVQSAGLESFKTFRATSNGGLVGTSSVADTSVFAAGSDYNQDPQNAYVFDASMESLNQVNMILCLMDQTEAEKMVNKGAYYALVDENKCEQGQNQSTSGTQGQSSAGNGKQYNRWVIDSTRADNSSPMEVRIWVPDSSSGNNSQDPAQNIMVDLTATEGVSADKPFGAFSLNFTGLMKSSDVGGTGDQLVPMMKGNLQTTDNGSGKSQFEFVNVVGSKMSGAPSGIPFGEDQRAEVILDDAAGTSGVAKTRYASTYTDQSGTQSEQRTYDIAFNSTRFKRVTLDKATGTPQEACASRESFNSNVWRYNLYHATDGTFNGNSVSAGERVRLNSGFPFRYNNGSTTVDGYVGYWGVWVNDGTDLPDGATIDRMTFNGSDAAAQYNVHVADGRMTRRKAVKKPLPSMAGEEFEAWDVQDGSGRYPYDLGYDSWIVTLDSNGNFAIIAGQKWGNDGPVRTDVTKYQISLASGEQLRLWSESLGGDVNYVGGASDLTFYGQEAVMPDDATLQSGDTLYCFDRCLKGGLTQANVDAATSDMDLFYPTQTDIKAPYTYTVQVSGGKVSLIDNTAQAAVSAVGLDMSSLDHDWGISTGNLVPHTTGMTSPWDAYGADVSYTWETGNNDWNRVTTVTDAGTGAMESFDQPLRFTYTVGTGDDRNGDTSKEGKTFMLEYGGNGDLWGLPSAKTAGNRWYPVVNLKDGVELSDGSNNFVVKAIEMEQTLKTATTGCATLAVDTTLSLPNETNISDVTFTWSDMPTPTEEAPAVIEGEVQ